MPRCGLQKLRRLLNAVYRRTTIVRIDMETVPPMRKTNNPYFGRVTKVASIVGLVGNWNYQDGVNRRRASEGKPADFVAEPPRWGTNDPDTCFRTYHGKVYVNVQVQRTLNSVLHLDGKPAPSDVVAAIKAFIPDRVEAPKQELDKPLVYRSVALTNIQGLKIGGQSFRIHRPRRK